jgi:hypothetical protein
MSTNIPTVPVMLKKAEKVGIKISPSIIENKDAIYKYIKDNVKDLKILAKNEFFESFQIFNNFLEKANAKSDKKIKIKYDKEQLFNYLKPTGCLDTVTEIKSIEKVKTMRKDIGNFVKQIQSKAQIKEIETKLNAESNIILRKYKEEELSVYELLFDIQNKDVSNIRERIKKFSKKSELTSNYPSRKVFAEIFENINNLSIQKIIKLYLKYWKFQDNSSNIELIKIALKQTKDGDYIFFNKEKLDEDYIKYKNNQNDYLQKLVLEYQKQEQLYEQNTEERKKTIEKNLERLKEEYNKNMITFENRLKNEDNKKKKKNIEKNIEEYKINYKKRQEDIKKIEKKKLLNIEKHIEKIHKNIQKNTELYIQRKEELKDFDFKKSIKNLESILIDEIKIFKKLKNSMTNVKERKYQQKIQLILEHDNFIKNIQRLVFIIKEMLDKIDDDDKIKLDNDILEKELNINPKSKNIRKELMNKYEKYRKILQAEKGPVDIIYILRIKKLIEEYKNFKSYDTKLLNKISDYFGLDFTNKNNDEILIILKDTYKDIKKEEKETKNNYKIFQNFLNYLDDTDEKKLKRLQEHEYVRKTKKSLSPKKQSSDSDNKKVSKSDSGLESGKDSGLESGSKSESDSKSKSVSDSNSKSVSKSDSKDKDVEKDTFIKKKAIKLTRSFELYMIMKRFEDTQSNDRNIRIKIDQINDYIELLNNFNSETDESKKENLLKRLGLVDEKNVEIKLNELKKELKAAQIVEKKRTQIRKRMNEIKEIYRNFEKNYKTENYETKKYEIEYLNLLKEDKDNQYSDSFISIKIPEPIKKVLTKEEIISEQKYRQQIKKELNEQYKIKMQIINIKTKEILERVKEDKANKKDDKIADIQKIQYIELSKEQLEKIPSIIDDIFSNLK